MSGLEAVLAEHDEWDVAEDGSVVCRCGFWLGYEMSSAAELDALDAADRTHVAAAIREYLIAQADTLRVRNTAALAYEASRPGLRSDGDLAVAIRAALTAATEEDV